jgi:hypothetical protein
MFLLAAAIVAAVFVHAAALTEAVNTPFRMGAATGFTQASNVVYGGAIAAISTTTGLLVPATDTTTNMLVVGCIRTTSDNGGLLAANYSSTRKVSAQRGVFRWDNGDTFTVADVGQLCYIEDDHTVQKAASATYDVPVGVIVEVDADGVWVDTTSLSKILTGSFGTLTVSGDSAVTGASTVGGTLAVTGALTGSSTVGATGFKIGAVSGYTGVVTNKSTISTNVIFYYGGIVTNATRNP